MESISSQRRVGKMTDFPKLLWRISNDQKSCYEERWKFLANIVHKCIKDASSLFKTKFLRGVNLGYANGELTKLISEKTGIEFVGVDPAPPKNSGKIRRIISGYADKITLKGYVWI